VSQVPRASFREEYRCRIQFSLYHHRVFSVGVFWLFLNPVASLEFAACLFHGGLDDGRDRRDEFAGVLVCLVGGGWRCGIIDGVNVLCPAAR
jgi:hypothetical protein